MSNPYNTVGRPKTRKARRPRQNHRQWIAQLLLAGLALVVLCGAGGGSYVAARQITKEWSGTGGFLGPQLVEGTTTPHLNEQGTPLPPPPGEVSEAVIPGAELTAWDGAGRVTVLLLGLDYRDWEQTTDASRSDTMILLTLDPQAKTAGVLSIPRDLWVAIPGFKHGKINTAYYLGDAYKLPGGGPALATKTVEQLLGVPINYYAQIDFEAFIRFIDEIGGVEIDVPAPIKIDLLGDGNNTIKRLQAGRQVLPGAYALAYARNRHTNNGDFDRAARQQQVIMAIRKRILDFEMLPKLISKAPDLYSELASGIRTNLTLDDVVKLALLAQSVPEDKIQQAIINKDNVQFAFSPDGLSILIPIPDDIHNLRDQLFATSSSLGPQVPGSPQEQMRTEAARIIIYNGSGDPGMGARAEAYLKGFGANVIQVTQSAQQAATSIVDHRGSPYAVKTLVDLLHIGSMRIKLEFDPAASTDVELYLGSDLVQSGWIP